MYGKKLNQKRSTKRIIIQSPSLPPPSSHTAPPSLKLTQSPVSVLEGRSLVLSCKASASPLPSFQWKKMSKTSHKDLSQSPQHVSSVKSLRPIKTHYSQNLSPVHRSPLHRPPYPPSLSSTPLSYASSKHFLHANAIGVNSVEDNHGSQELVRELFIITISLLIDSFVNFKNFFIILN